MTREKIEKLKDRYEEAQRGLDQLQEEILARGMELRPGLRRQFEEALRGLFYAMAYADGKIDEREVAFYNYLFDEELSTTTFELVMTRLHRSSKTFEDDLMAAVTTFAQYDRAITGEIPLNAPSLTALLLAAAETVGNLVIAVDGEVDRSEMRSLRELIQNCKQRANLISEGGEELLRGGGTLDYDPDALVERDLRGLRRRVCSTLTELVFGAVDIVVQSGVGTPEEVKASAVIVESIRDDLERGQATADQMILAAGQMKVAYAGLRMVHAADNELNAAWSALAAEALAGFASLPSFRAECEARVRSLREKHDWHPDVDRLEEALQQVWANFLDLA